MQRKAPLLASIAAALALALGAGPAVAQLAQTPAPPNPQAQSAWQDLLLADLDYLATVIPRDYIYASYPEPDAFAEQLERSLAEARGAAHLVRDFGGYRGVLQRFISSFEDAHFSAYFSNTDRSAYWPGFTVAYRGGAYVVEKSIIDGVAPGAVVERCDGRDMHEVVDGLSEYLGGPRGRETTRAKVAMQVMVDYGNPFYEVPGQCRINGEEVALEWRLAPPAMVGPEPSRTSASAPTLEDGSVGVRDFGSNGAWVRMGTMMPLGPVADDFQALVDAAPGLRDRDVVVIDVRGNAGGVYNWFMAFLRGFYGQPYADHYARARLEVSNVMMTPPGATGLPFEGFTGEAAQMRMPPDPVKVVGGPEQVALPNGGRLEIHPAPVESMEYAPSPPPNPVTARVYVLADYGCGSACISFVDEMMRFPGVTLVGTETHIDRRSGGWPGGLELPSGMAVVRMGRGVRMGRARGGNEAWVPAPEYRFPGDITDTEAVEEWLLGTVLRRDLARREPWRQTAVLKGPEPAPEEE